MKGRGFIRNDVNPTFLPAPQRAALQLTLNFDPSRNTRSKRKQISASGANILDHRVFSSSHDFPKLHWCINRTQIQSVLFLCSSSLSLSVRFICDNLALPVPCHWERINTDEPYQVSKITNIVGTSFQGLK